MVILVVPMLSQKILNSDSNYAIISKVVPRMLEEHPDWLFDILWPVNSSDWTYYNDGFFDHPNIKRTPFYFDSNKMRQVASFEGRAWQKLLDYKGNHYDLIWNNTVEIGDVLRFYEPRYDVRAQSIVVNFHHYVLHDSLNYPVRKTYEHLMVRQVASQALVHAHVANSDHCKRMLLDNAQEFLSENMLTRMTENMRIINVGTLDLDQLDRVRQDRHPIFTFAWNHRLQDYKQWRTTFDQFDKLWSSRQDFRVQVHGSIASDKISNVARRPYVDVVETPGHDQYLAALSRCHANVINSLHETFCISAVESMAFNQTLIAPNDITFPEITGARENDYPYLFDTTDSQLAMMNSVIDGDEGWGEVVGKHVRSRYTADVTADAYAGLFSELTDFDVMTSVKRTEEWEGLITAKQDWEMQELRHAAYRARSNKGGVLAAGQSFPCVKIKRVANSFGYKERWGDNGELLLTRSPDA